MLTRRGLGSASLATATTAALAAWATSAPVASGATTVPTGTVRFGRDTAIAADLTVGPGTRFEIAAGATLTLTGDIVAPATMIFAGPGRVDLSRSRVVAARPEWWGAVADDPATDCAPALHACLAAHPAMQLGLGDYHLSQTFRVDRSDRRIWGIGRAKGYRGTRLLLRGGSGPVVLVGTEIAPVTVNAFLWGIDLRWLELGRTAPPTRAHGTAADAVGLRLCHVVDCVFDGIRANEHATGFDLTAAVRTFLRDCAAFRSVPGDGADTFVGFDLDGRVPPAAIGTGANASLYLTDCTARTGGTPRLGQAVGIRLTGTLADTFIDRFETTDVDVGVLVDGRRDALTAAQRANGHVDLHIRGAVLDQCRDAGIRLGNLSTAALIDIGDPYVALSPTGTAAIDLVDCGGGIGIGGGQLIGAGTAAPATGIRLRRVSGIAVAGTKLQGFARPVEATAATAFDLDVGINATTPAGLAPGPAIRLVNCAHGHVRPRITGRAAFTCGVAADRDCDAVDIATAGIVPAALTGGDPVRVDDRPVADTAPGRVWLAAAAR